ncbi:MAG: hypothetical protein MMC23_008274 [Stictis urceolatum]|nr:hypothetical protein [Stictis urceolata]
MAALRVLVSGAGITGPVVAYWLAVAGCQVTLVERADELRANGQGVDIRGAGIEVIRRMGIEQAIRDHTTKEEGIAVVDENNRVQGEFPAADPSEGTDGLTGEIEILRGNLVRILWEATKDKVDYRFGTRITNIQESAEAADVHFNNEASSHRYDAVIVADGLFSRTRTLAFTDTLDGDDPVAALNAHCAYFTLSRTKDDTGLARILNIPGRRGILIRPVDATTSSAYLTVITSESQQPTMRALQGKNAHEQKEYLRKMFSDVGWEAPRVLEAMDQADDFYLQELAQIKMPTWSSSHGRVVCVGDAAHSPSPLTGMGTTVAIVGPYALAGEIAKQIKEANGESATIDIKKACAEWEQRIRPWIERAQKIPPGAPWIVNPETSWGIWILRSIVMFAARSGLAKKLGDMTSPPAKWEGMPGYKF